MLLRPATISGPLRRARALARGQQETAIREPGDKAVAVVLDFIELVSAEGRYLSPFLNQDRRGQGHAFDLPAERRFLACLRSRLYIYTVHISVTVLYRNGKRLSAYAVKRQAPAVGWLHYEVDGDVVRAFLRRQDGRELLALDRAQLVACRGTRGALIEGVVYRKKGVKHSIADQQAWWCEAPPRRTPLLDHQAHVLAAAKVLEGQIAAGWGPA